MNQLEILTHNDRCSWNGGKMLQLCWKKTQYHHFCFRPLSTLDEADCWQQIRSQWLPHTVELTGLTRWWGQGSKSHSQRIQDGRHAWFPPICYWPGMCFWKKLTWSYKEWFVSIWLIHVPIVWQIQSRWSGINIKLWYMYTKYY